ncbi:MAG: hypothetical protein K2K97_03075, partial [Muribaculaceae bacterium]|nr:hypothetical protein [Muribaculaceae bacterium]
MMKVVKLLILIPLLLGMASCGGASDPDPDPWTEVGDMEVNLCLQVSVSDAAGTDATTTRAGEDEKYFIGQDGEQVPIQDPMWVYEKINTLRVIIVRPDSTIEYNFMESLPSMEAVEHFKELMFKVSTSQGIPDATNPNIRIEKKRIYLIANEAAIEPKELRDKISHFIPGEKIDPSGFNGSGAPLWLLDNNWPVSGNAVPIVDNENSDSKKFIPMTEFFDVDVKFDISKGASHRVQTEKMFITRNLVKFQFEIDAPALAYYDYKIRIKKIEFGNLSQKEYLFPCETVYYPAKDDKDAAAREILRFKTPGMADNQTRRYDFLPANFGFPDNTEDTPSGLYKEYNPAIYFCESQNYTATSTSEEIYTINVTAEFIGPDGNSLEITFNRKNLPNLQALPRNTIVKIRLIFSLHDMYCEAVVFPYTGVYLNPTFGFENEVNEGKLSATSLQLTVGDIATLTPTFDFANDETNKNLIWTTSNPFTVRISPASEEVTTVNGQTLELPASEKVKLAALKPTLNEDTGKDAPVRINVYAQNGKTATCSVTVAANI